MKRKFPTLIVRIFLFQLAHAQYRDILYSNILRSQAKYSEVYTAWNTPLGTVPCSSEGRVALLSVT